MLNGIYNRQTPRNSTIPENIEELGPRGPCSPIFSGIVEFLGVYLYVTMTLYQVCCTLIDQ